MFIVIYSFVKNKYEKRDSAHLMPYRLTQTNITSDIRKVYISFVDIISDMKRRLNIMSICQEIMSTFKS